MISVRDGATLWTRRFNERYQNIGAVQNSISEEVAWALMPQLTQEDERGWLTSRRAENARAYEAYLRGRFFWNKRTKEGYERAIEHFNQALVIAPDYAEAHAGLADAYSLLSCVVPFDRRHERMRIAKEKALQALRIDETIAEAHATLGFIAWHYEWDWATSEREFKRAIELNPSYATAHHWYAYLLIALERQDEAIAEIERARELDPLSLIINKDVSEMLLIARRFDKAIEQARRTVELDPQSWSGWQARSVLADCYYQKRMYRESLAEREQQVIESNRDPGALRWLAANYLRLGYREQGQRVLDELEQRGESLGPMERYWAFRDKDKAFEWLEYEYENRGGGLTHLKVHPLYDDLHSDPRFADLVRRVGLP